MRKAKRLFEGREKILPLEGKTKRTFEKSKFSSHNNSQNFERKIKMNDFQLFEKTKCKSQNMFGLFLKKI